MKLRQSNVRGGFTLIDFLVIVAVVAILVAILLPARPSHRVPAARITCTNNLKQIGLAYHQWALGNNDKFPPEVSVTNGGAMEAVTAGNVAAVFQVMSNELSTPKLLFCPEDRRRIQATSFSEIPPIGRTHGGVYFSKNSNVSYFANLDATRSSPNMFLSGDDNWLVGGEVFVVWTRLHAFT